jgi:hypothetical protein
MTICWFRSTVPEDVEDARTVDLGEHHHVHAMVERRERFGDSFRAARKHDGHLVEVVVLRNLALEEEEGGIVRLVVLEVAFAEHRDAPLRPEPVVNAGLLVLDVTDDEIGRVVDDLGLDRPF